MLEMKILCWNINGIRAAYKHGFLEWLRQELPDILCLQETKATQEDLIPELKTPPGYLSFWNNPAKKGYCGVATYCREMPLEILKNIENAQFDTEGRILITRYNDFTLYNVYFPNGKQNAARLQYKLSFYDAILEDMERRRQKGENLIICGDYNTAHREIDLARPKENSKISGFLPVERAWLDKIIDLGYIDVFRYFNHLPGQYTWWDMKTRARERDVGWRIDYFFITANLLPRVTQAAILKDIMGSDHCPISLTLKTD